jgi:hypothetical protein
MRWGAAPKLRAHLVGARGAVRWRTTPGCWGMWRVAALGGRTPSVKSAQGLAADCWGRLFKAHAYAHKGSGRHQACTVGTQEQSPANGPGRRGSM